MTRIHSVDFPDTPHLMLHALAANWWILFLRGVCGILFGLLAFIWPGLTLMTLMLLYGTFAPVDGILAIAAAIMRGAPAPCWWLSVVGFLGIAAGLATFLWPAMTALVLLLLIAGWAVAPGIMQFAGAIRLRKEIDHNCAFQGR